MDAKSLMKQIRKIELKTKHLSKEAFSGEYHSAFKGKGMAFSEVKSYQYGDDVRNIDWNVTARFNEPFVKIFEEERELNVMLLLDVSKSMEVTSGEKSKKQLLIEIVATIGFSAAQNNDKVGAIFISDKVELFIPPKKGRSHVLMIIKKLIDHSSQSKTTDISEGLRYFRNILKKRSIAFLISDYNDENDFIDSSKIVARNHDLVALKLFDPIERELPKLGFIKMYNAESGKFQWVNSYSSSIRNDYRNTFDVKQAEFLEKIRRIGAEGEVISTSTDFVKLLIKLFANRKR